MLTCGQQRLSGFAETIFQAVSEKEWRRAFERVPLKEGVDREKAFKLIMITLDYFDKKYFSDLKDNNDLKETHLQEYIEESNTFLSMIRFGISGAWHDT